MINSLEKFARNINFDWNGIFNYVFMLFITIIVAFGVVFLIRLFITNIFKKTHFVSEKKKQTIESVIRNTSNYIAFFIVLLTAIKPFVDVKELLVAGGVIGIVIGFGAQSLIKDLLSGAFMIFERTIQKGDFVHVNGEPDGGTVEEIGFRVVKIRLVNGKLLTVPNGEIRKMLNGSVERRRIFESVIVSFEENPARVKKLLEELCEELNVEAKDYLKIDNITGEPIELFQVYGLSSLDYSPLGYRFSVQATVNDTDYLISSQIAKELIAQKFYDNKVLMPSQHIVLRN